MPIYEYECDGCHHVFEVRQKVSDPMPTSHSCGSTQVRRILSATSFVLKGTGWYATDYGNRKEGSKTDDKPEAAAQKGGAQASGDKNESGGAGTSEARAADPKEATQKAAAPSVAPIKGGAKTQPS